MVTEKEIKLVFNRVEIQVLVTETCNDIRIQYFNPGTLDFVENLSELKHEWTFHDKDLQKEYDILIEMAKLIDKKLYKDINAGEIIKFDNDGRVTIENGSKI